MTVSSLMGAVEFSGNFDSVGRKQVECARASELVFVFSACLQQMSLAVC